jgi:MoxR-like ATPase
MEEHQVTQEGETRALPEPFFVIATQNPSHQIGTFPLPESQLDRFLMRIELGYPDAAAERALFRGEDRREMLKGLQHRMGPGELLAAQQVVPRVHVSDALLDYLQALLAFTRQSPEYQGGLSPRAGLAVLRGSQAWAALHGRGYVLPEDLQAVLPGVVGHRLRPAEAAGAMGSAEVAARLIAQVPIP